MCALCGRVARRGSPGRRERVKGWAVAGERKGERAGRVEGEGGFGQEVEREGEARGEVSGERG